VSTLESWTVKDRARPLGRSGQVGHTIHPSRAISQRAGGNAITTGDLWTAYRGERGAYRSLNRRSYRTLSHALAHTAVFGVPTSVIMEMQGWKTEAMFRRYAIVDRKDKLATYTIVLP